MIALHMEREVRRLDLDSLESHFWYMFALETIEVGICAVTLDVCRAGIGILDGVASDEGWVYFDGSRSGQRTESVKTVFGDSNAPAGSEFPPRMILICMLDGRDLLGAC